MRVRQNSLAICIFALTLIYGRINAQNSIISPDSAWVNMPKLFFADQNMKLCDIDSPTTKELEECFIARCSQISTTERFNQAFWNWGVKFWKNYPLDKRRFEWLLQATYPFYFKDIEQGSEDLIKNLYSAQIDTNARRVWKNQYINFRNEYMSSFQLSLADREKLIFKELMDDIWKGKWQEIRKSEKFDYYNWAKRAIKYAKYWYQNLDDSDYEKKIILGEHDYLQENLVLQPFVSSANLGLNLRDRENFMKLFLKSGVLRLQEQAQVELTGLALYNYPFSFRAISFDGEEIDFKNIHKLVLFDFWDIHCESCIRLMPFIKQVYDKYKKFGFEVISVCALESDDEKGEKKRAIEIYRKTNSNWPLILVNKRIWKPLYKKYGFTSLANVLLFDRNRKLIIYNEGLLDGNKIQSIVETNLKL
jgi:thiol-disulfide isomerase/thioredoxin